MRLLLVLLAVLLLTACTSYRGVITAPDGRKYIVEQNKAGTIEVDDGGVKIKAGTLSESRIEKLLDVLMLREIRTKE